MTINRNINQAITYDKFSFAKKENAEKEIRVIKYSSLRNASILRNVFLNSHTTYSELIKELRDHTKHLLTNEYKLSFNTIATKSNKKTFKVDLKYIHFSNTKHNVNIFKTI